MLVKLVTVFIILFVTCSNLHSKPDPFDKDAITTSLKDAYLSARWVENFERYIKTYSDIKSLKELTDGLFRIQVISYCLKPGVPVDNKNTYSYVLAPLKGNKAGLIKEVIKRSIAHKEIEQKFVQTLLWGILAGFSYSDYPDDFAKKIAPLVPDEEKNKKSGVNIKDILNLPIPKEVKEQMSVVSDLRKLISEGISRYDEIERISMPDKDPEVNKNDVKIDDNCWTLMDNGYYVRPKPGGSRSRLEIYRPDEVTLTYDSKGRVNTMSSPSGILELEYDDNPGADVITYPSSNSYKINRVSGIKLNGESIGKVMKMLWYTTMDSRTNETSQYKRKEIGVVTDPLEASMVYRDVKIKTMFEYFNKYNKDQKLSTGEEKELYELKQIEYCMKFVLDSMRFQVKEESIEKIIRIATDAAARKFTEKVKEIYPKGGSQNTDGFDFPFSVAVPGNNAQRIGITGEGTEEEGDPGLPPVSTEGDPPLPPDTNRTPPECSITIMQFPQNILPMESQIFATNVNIECNRPIDEITWTLSDISREQGRCLNDKNPSYYKTSPDLDIVIDPSLNPDYSITTEGNTITATGGRNAVRMLALKTLDFGAFGKLSVKVRIGSNYFYGTGEGWSNNYIRLPYDMDENNIADSWENENSVAGYGAELDEDDQPSEQHNDGDGMSLYEEYRGFYILTAEMTNVHKRMNPHQKELFVIDPELLISLTAWKRMSGIDVYRISTECSFGDLGGSGYTNVHRWINFCRGYAPGNKYAIRLETAPGMEDPYNFVQDTLVFGYCHMGPPKNSTRFVVFPIRIERYITYHRNRIAELLSGSSERILEYDGTRCSRSFLERLVNWMDDESTRYLIQNFILSRTVHHELGHGCSIEHHGNGVPGMEFTGNTNCVMRGTNFMIRILHFWAEFIEFRDGVVEEGTLPFFEGSYIICRDPDNCYSKININDNLP